MIGVRGYAASYHLPMVGEWWEVWKGSDHPMAVGEWEWLLPFGIYTVVGIVIVCTVMKGVRDEMSISGVEPMDEVCELCGLRRGAHSATNRCPRDVSTYDYLNGPGTRFEGR